MRPRVLAAALAALLTAGTAHAQDPTVNAAASGLFWRNRPSIQLGDVRLDVRMQFARDWRRFDPAIGEDEAIWRMRRGGINGEIGEHFEFEIEHDFFRGGSWRDLFIRWRTHRQVEISAGRFKVPFGREQHVSTTRLDFAARALASNLIAPGRDKGVMASGGFAARGLTYEFGVFDGDGDNGEPRAVEVPGTVIEVGPSVAGRITALPLQTRGAAFDTLRVGFAYGGASIPAGLNSLGGETVYGTATFFAPVYVNGRRTRAGVELSYLPGPVGLTAEWMQAREQRRAQAVDGRDLSDLVTTGWYTAATWLLTGEAKQGFEYPRRPLFAGGIGALEVAVRYEHLGFASANQEGPALVDPRAEHLRGNHDRVWTFGVNWFANRWVRATVNAVREEFDDRSRTPQPGTPIFWSGIGRLQLAF